MQGEREERIDLGHFFSNLKENYDGEDLEVYSHIRDIYYLLPKIATLNIESYFSLIYHLPGLALTIFNIKHFFELNSELSTKILSNDILFQVLEENSIHIKTFLQSNQAYLAKILTKAPNSSGGENNKVNFLKQKSKEYFQRNQLKILSDLIHGSTLDNISDIFKEINEHEELKIAIANVISGRQNTLSTGLSENIQSLIETTSFVDNIINILNSQELKNIIQNFARNLNWEDYNEAVCYGTQQQENVEISDELIFKMAKGSFSLFDDFNKYGHETEKFSPFLDNISSIRFLFDEFAIKKTSEDLLAKLRQEEHLSEMAVEQIRAALNSEPSPTINNLEFALSKYNNVREVISNFLGNNSSQARIKAILAIVRNLRPFIEESHNDPEKTSIKSLASLITNLLIGDDQVPAIQEDNGNSTDGQENSQDGQVPAIQEDNANSTDGQKNSQNAVLTAINKIMQEKEKNKYPLKSLHLGRDSFKSLIIEVLNSYSDPKYRDEISIVLLNFIPALLEKNMTVVVKESIHAIALNDTFRSKIQEDPSLQDILLDILIAHLNFTSKQEAKNNIARLDKDVITAIDNAINGNDDSIYESIPNNDDTRKAFNDYKLSIKGEGVFGIRIVVLREFLKRILTGFVDKIHNDDENTKNMTTSLITWFTSPEKNPNELFSRIFNLIEQNNDMKAIVVNEDAKNDISELLKDILTVNRYNETFIKNTNINWNDMKVLISKLLTHLPYNLSVEVENNTYIKGTALNILSFLIKQDKTPADTNGFFRDVFEIVGSIEDLRKELQVEDFRQNITNIIMAVIKDSLKGSNLASKDDILALNIIIKSVLEHIPAAAAADVSTKQATKNILGFFIKEDKTPIDMHNFYANIIAVANDCPNFVHAIESDPNLRASLSKLVSHIINNSMELENKDYICAQLDIIINKCLEHSVKEEVKPDLQTILDFFAHYERNNGKVSPTEWLLSVINVIEKTSLEGELKSNDELVSAIKNVIDAFTPKHHIVKNFILDLDHARVKLLLTDPKYRDKLKGLLQDIESKSWLKVFTIPLKAVSLITTIFLQRNKNRTTVFCLLSLLLSIMSYSFMNKFIVLAPLSIPFSIFLGLALIVMRFKSYILKNDFSKKVALSCVSGLSLGISVALITSAYSFLAMPLFIVAIFSAVACITMNSNKSLPPVTQQYENKPWKSLKDTPRHRPHRGNHNTAIKTTPMHRTM